MKIGSAGKLVYQNFGNSGLAEWKTFKIFRKISKISHGLLYILNQKSFIERRDHDRSSQILDSLKFKMIRVCQCDTNYKMAIRSIPDSLFKSLIQYPNLEILHRNWLGVRTYIQRREQNVTHPISKVLHKLPCDQRRGSVRGGPTCL